MSATIRLTVLTGPHKEQRFCFRASTHCILGRAADCLVQLSGTERDQQISRHHCELNIASPCMRIRDLGSKNGTYINGKKVNPVEQGIRDFAEAINDVPPFSGINSGDILTVGGTTLRVDVVDCPSDGIDPEGKVVWQAGQTTKKDCSVRC